VIDVTALSHEIVEIYNDPFVNDITPWWISPNGNCQNDLETEEERPVVDHHEWIHVPSAKRSSCSGSRA